MVINFSSETVRSLVESGVIPYGRFSDKAGEREVRIAGNFTWYSINMCDDVITVEAMSSYG
jgi:hypothetical protein